MDRNSTSKQTFDPKHDRCMEEDYRIVFYYNSYFFLRILRNKLCQQSSYVQIY